MSQQTESKSDGLVKLPNKVMAHCPEETRDEVKPTDLESSKKTQKGVNVSEKHWQKFQELQKRRQHISKRSTEKRIKRIQDDVMQKVQEEFSTTDDLDVLRQHDVELPGLSPNKKVKRVYSCNQSFEDKTIDEAAIHSSHKVRNTDSETKWLNIKPYLTCNDHLTVLDRGKYAPKTNLEEEVDSCIDKGDFAKAEELSDQLANREFGKKIADAIDAKSYVSEKEKEEEQRKAKRKKRLNWGFEQKHKWETKSNM